MAEKRMFAKTIIDSDAFLEMPVTSQLLYFHLSMRADDEGFINKPKAIMKMVGANDDDLKILFMKKFVIPFDSGVVVIKHWRINNYIRKDMFHETTYKEERAMLEIDENNAYRLPVTSSLQECNKLTTQISIDKNSIDKNSIDKNISNTKKFTKPSIEEIQEYIQSRSSDVDPNRFYDYYESIGWKVGKNPMKDWKACVRTWERKIEKPAEDERKYIQEW